MSTPSYLGAVQHAGHPGGWLSRLSSYFGGSGTPAYAAAGQPASTDREASDGTPAYAPAPDHAPEATHPRLVCACTQVEEEEATGCPIDADALAAGQIAIVIPRQGT